MITKCREDSLYPVVCELYISPCAWSAKYLIAWGTNTSHSEWWIQWVLPYVDHLYRKNNQARGQDHNESSTSHPKLKQETVWNCSELDDSRSRLVARSSSPCLWEEKRHPEHPRTDSDLSSFLTWVSGGSHNLITVEETWLEELGEPLPCNNEVCELDGLFCGGSRDLLDRESTGDSRNGRQSPTLIHNVPIFPRHELDWRSIR